MAQIDLLNQNTVTTILSEIEGSENRNRKVQTWSAYQISHGDILPYVTNDVKKFLPKSWKQMRMSDISLSEKVNKKLSQAYKEPPVRTLDNPQDSQSLNELYDDMRVDQKFMEFDFISNLNRYSLMWVNWREEVGLQLIPLHPFEFDVIRDPKDGTLEVVILNYPDTTITHQVPLATANSINQADGVNQAISNKQADSSATTKNYAIWTKDQHVSIRADVRSIGNGKVETTITYVDIEDNPNNVNPLGVLPFVYYSKDDGGNPTDYPVVNPITRQAIFYNVLNSDLLSAASLQGYGIRTISATQDILNSMQVLHEGLTTAVELPQSEDTSLPETKLDFVSPSPDLAGQRETYLAYLTQVLSQHGINAGSIVTGGTESFSSGLDRAIANADVQNVVRQNQIGYADIEKEVFEIIKVWQREIVRDIVFAEDDVLSIYYPRPQVLISDKETLENIDKRMSMGLLRKHEALMMLNPNLNEEQAIEKVQTIEEEKMNRASMFFGGNDGNQSRPANGDRPVGGVEESSGDEQE